jgi:hypothetical protein
MNAIENLPLLAAFYLPCMNSIMNMPSSVVTASCVCIGRVEEKELIRVGVPVQHVHTVLYYKY